MLLLVVYFLLSLLAGARRRDIEARKGKYGHLQPWTWASLYYGRTSQPVNESFSCLRHLVPVHEYER